MNLLKPKRLIFLIIILAIGFWLFLNYNYLLALIKYYSVAGSGLSYSLKGRTEVEKETTIIKPVSTLFGLVIPKLGLNKEITGKVDLYQFQKLESVLTQGLVQAEVSVLPGERGKVLIIGHPLHNFFNFKRLNPDFYLISQLEAGDEIIVFFRYFEFSYRVTKKEFQSPTYLDFFDPGEERGLVLVSGYPPGMALRFLVVEAEGVD
jgi:sortase (surface protein transpeptidase)